MLNKISIIILSLLIGIFILGCGVSKGKSDAESINKETQNPASDQTKEISKPINNNGINWTTYEEGFKLSKEQGKPIMIYFYADWCRYCKKMEEETYANNYVIEEAKRYVCVKVDLTKPDEKARAIAKKYNVEGLPTVIFIDYQGNFQEGNTSRGFVKFDQLIGAMQRLRSRNE